MSANAVLFDVDGTLVDSNYFHAIAWFRAFRAHDYTFTFNEIHRLIGMGADQMLERLIPDGNAEDIEKAWQREFNELREEIAPTPGAGDLVRAMKERGLTTVYATSGQPDDVDALRKVIGADQYVDHTVNSSEVEASKPAPDIFEQALARAGVAPDQAIVIGDTAWDVEAAAACGLRCVGVLTGGISEAELSAAGAIAVYESPQELLDDLEDSPLARLFS